MNLPTADIWQQLSAEKRDILLYGMGNGADKLLLEAARRHIPIRGIFASDGFVRGHCFHDMPVRAFSEVRRAYPDGSAVVLLAFGSARPDVLDTISAVAEHFPLFVPDLPLCGESLFDADFLQRNNAQLLDARALLSDDASKSLFDAIVRAKLSAALSDLLAAVSAHDPFWYIEKSGKAITAAADLGAYNGDSATELAARFPLRFLLAAEPDRRTFKKLQRTALSLDLTAELFEGAISDRVGEAAFDASGNRNAGLHTGRTGTVVKTASLDALLQGRAVDYIKYDIEGAEREGLLGAAATIRTHRPILRVSLYHRPEDLFALPLLLHSIAPDYDLYLTRARSLPLWDIDLVAIPRHV